jgi:hypothetical protein
MKTCDLRKLLEAVPYDFNVHIETPVNITQYTAEAKVENRERNIAELKAEIAALRAYVAGVKVDAFPESEGK